MQWKGGGHLCSQEKSPEGLKRREKPRTGAGPDVVDQLDPETIKAKGWGRRPGKVRLLEVSWEARSVIGGAEPRTGWGQGQVLGISWGSVRVGGKATESKSPWKPGGDGMGEEASGEG